MRRVPSAADQRLSRQSWDEENGPPRRVSQYPPVPAIEGVPTGTPSIRGHFVSVSNAAVSKKIVSAANLPFLIFHTSSTSPLAVLPFGKA
jgi:hypothetical protein